MHLSSLFQLIEKILLPYRCVMCLEKSDQKRDLCSCCQQDLTTLPYTCKQCGIILPKAHQKCGQCFKKPPYFDHTEVGFEYKAPIAHWLKQFKFHKKGLYARILSEIFAEQLSQSFRHHPEKKPQLLIPVPLHWKRLIQRGFNQAQTIANYLSHALQIPLINHQDIIRIKSTRPQSRLDQKKRQQNIKNAFYLIREPKVHHVAIIDDIMTTGNTVNELAKLLKRAGVPYISVWTLARTAQ